MMVQADMVAAVNATREEADTGRGGDRDNGVRMPSRRKARGTRGEVPLSERAYQTIEEKIVVGELPAGKALSEGALAELLGMGRTPVREALQRLAGEGLVQILPQRGVLVSDITVDDYLKLMEARRPLDVLIADIVSSRASDSQRMRIAEIAVLFDEARSVADERLFMHVDREFNGLLCEASGNVYLARMSGLLQGQSRRFYFRHRHRTDFSETAGLHGELARAIAAGDPGRAGKAADAIIAFNIRLARDVLLDRR
jgi:DNA-binding GntR family transcriptional regulator